MSDDLFIVQPYIAKATGLVAQAAQVFPDEASARRAGGRLARYRAGVVVLSQKVDSVAFRRERPEPIAVYGRVPDAWGAFRKAA